jgi:hypothetical protein
MSEISTGHYQSPGRYEIRLKRHLDARWAGCLTVRDTAGPSKGARPMYVQALSGRAAPAGSRRRR